MGYGVFYNSINNIITIKKIINLYKKHPRDYDVLIAIFEDYSDTSNNNYLSDVNKYNLLEEIYIKSSDTSVLIYYNNFCDKEKEKNNNLNCTSNIYIPPLLMNRVKNFIGFSIDKTTHIDRKTSEPIDKIYKYLNEQQYNSRQAGAGEVVKKKKYIFYIFDGIKKLL